MITVGIDSGSKNTKAVLMKDDIVIDKVMIPTEFHADASAKKAYEKLLSNKAIKEEDVESIACTGTGREIVDLSKKTINEVGSAARGGKFLNSNAEMIIDIGADSSRVIKLDENGRVKKYEVNDKCASGAGTFVEAMARALNLSIDEIGQASLNHTKNLVTNAQCVVFAESEVISLIHDQESVENIAYGIHMGISNRIASLVRRIGTESEIMIIGGPGKNKGLVRCIEEIFDKDIFVSEETSYVSAIGAALFAAESQQ